ncbi:hypothetical protein F5Y18DRAFT_432312 [Xylariaceae sp. FL1019]|nr:hypothetical protein F5Y18DRAFT_432312 [Xylariaceae sp. FL1019]
MSDDIVSNVPVVNGLAAKCKCSSYFLSIEPPHVVSVYLPAFPPQFESTFLTHIKSQAYQSIQYHNKKNTIPNQPNHRENIRGEHLRLRFVVTLTDTTILQFIPPHLHRLPVTSFQVDKMCQYMEYIHYVSQSTLHYNNLSRSLTIFLNLSAAAARTSSPCPTADVISAAPAGARMTVPVLEHAAKRSSPRRRPMSTAAATLVLVPLPMIKIKQQQPRYLLRDNALGYGFEQERDT